MIIFILSEHNILCHRESVRTTIPRSRKKGQVNMLDRISLILVIIGAINWGSVGIFKFDFVGWLFGGQTAALSRIVFVLVGLAGLWCVSLLFRRSDESMERIDS